MRYRITFHARKDEDFNWETESIFESNELLELIFKFHIWIGTEFKKIITRSKELTGATDDIPF